jgi:hypothetical protein
MELLQLSVEKEIALQRERVEEDFAFKYKLLYQEKSDLLMKENSMLMERLKMYEQESE